MTVKYCCSGIVGEAITIVTVTAKKVIKAAVMHLTNIKSKLLNCEYNNLQAFLHGNNEVELYSANKQQAKRFYRKIKHDKEYPLSIRKDLLKVEEKDTKMTHYWARIPVAGRRGGVWVAIKPHCEMHGDIEIGESKLIRKDSRFFLNITVQKEVKIQYPSDPSKLAVIACDVGEANPVSFVTYRDGEISEIGFGATEVRGIRTHYNHLRKEIGWKKVKHGRQVIKKVGDAEHRRVNDAIHKATSEIVTKAKKLREKGYEVIITVWKQRKKYMPRCRKNNRKIHTMPSFEVKKQLEYKANWEGIPVMFVNEAYTSQLCWRCGSAGERKK